jgi:hypothetical protein
MRLIKYFMPEKSDLTLVSFCLLAPLVLVMATWPAASAHAATDKPNPDFTEPSSSEDETRQEDLDRLRSLDIAKPPPAPPGERVPLEYFHRYRQGLTLRLGSIYDTDPAKGSSPGFLGGAQYVFASANLLRNYEAGFDLLSDGTGVMHAAFRFPYSRTSFRPYTKAGAGIRLVPEDRLITFLRYQNYQIRGAAGFEWTIDDPVSIRLEAEAAIGMEQIQASVNMGAVFSF